MTGNDPDRPGPPLDALADAITACLDYCDANPGYNLPDLLAGALVQVARARGGSYALIAHRPGCWEATHIEALAAMADFNPADDHEEHAY